jgi:hypothetical protein
MKKLTRSRKNYLCHECRGPISKGDLYRKKTVSIGNPSKETIEKRDDVLVVVSHGLRFGVQVCETCAVGEQGS